MQDVDCTIGKVVSNAAQPACMRDLKSDLDVSMTRISRSTSEKQLLEPGDSLAEDGCYF